MSPKVFYRCSGLISKPLTHSESIATCSIIILRDGYTACIVYPTLPSTRTPLDAQGHVSMLMLFCLCSIQALSLSILDLTYRPFMAYVPNPGYPHSWEAGDYIYHIYSLFSHNSVCLFIACRLYISLAHIFCRYVYQ